PQPDDVAIDILFCGVCHSDLHTVRGEWGGTLYPCVPGHEIVGRVTAVGSNVTKFAVGDIAGVGCMVDSCGHCPSCTDGEEQYCETTGFVGTYNGPDPVMGGHTMGGYSDQSFQIPNPRGLTPSHGYNVGGVTNFLSDTLDERQHERTAFGLASLLHD
ncbi:alcohol dehydrogenase catalytic domain-containing protein, partial [Pseudomonas sp. EL_65y_Pfl2_R96]|uniref:alcohol dehydrogenase catalytic domain-containing protein n=1 Tax=Pseudomonas sp. EL_65y_Pfl2_R96 TaxID=3088699 RepID=UPI0030D7683E